MKAETADTIYRELLRRSSADTIYRELLRRSSADGLAYLREQLAAHEAKGYESGQRDADARQWAETRALGA